MICVREGVKGSLREALRLVSTLLCDALLSSLPDCIGVVIYIYFKTGKKIRDH